MFVYVYTHLCMYMCLYTEHVYLYMCICLYVCVYAYVDVCILCTYMCKLKTENVHVGVWALLLCGAESQRLQEGSTRIA